MMDQPSLAEKFLSSQQHDSVLQCSEDGLEAVFARKRTSKFRPICSHFAIHLSFLALYTFVIFLLWPKITPKSRHRGLDEVYC